jgi:hypothetical protein
MTGTGRARFPRPIDATLHGATDYTVATTLMTALPRLAGISGTQAGRQVRLAGAIHAGYSTLTNYPLGVIKVLPYKAHRAIDAVGALALAATPFVTGQFRKGRNQWLPHVALGLVELGSLALSDPTGRGNYKADVEAVRRGNAEDPRRKVYDRTPAVRRGAARQHA